MTRSGTGAAAPTGGSRFADRVHAAVATVPVGTVVTYGELAAEIGRPGAARAVGQAMRGCPEGLAWWRVVPASGRLPAHLARRQAALLRAEGVAVADGRVMAMDGRDPA